MRWFNFDLVVALQDGEEDVAAMVQQVANLLADGEYDPSNPATSNRPFEMRVRELVPPPNANPDQNLNGAAPVAEEEYVPGGDTQ